MTKTNIQIQCKDGFELAATLYLPKELRAAVFIAPATGIKKRFYNSFATFLADNGYGVICYDNRGIGASKKGNINKMDASLINWGRLDMSAVLEELMERFPNTSYHIVGHSAGGQLVGLMDNGKEIQSMFNFACSSGSIRNMKHPFKLQAIFFMSIFMPLSNLIFGQANSHWMGMGEALPIKVAQQWTKWCNGTGYVATDFGKEIKSHFYNELILPSLWLHAEDDGIANIANVKDMVRVHPNSKAEIVTLNPKQNGFKSIGHMSFFSSKYKVLWNYTLDWLAKN